MNQSDLFVGRLLRTLAAMAGVQKSQLSETAELIRQNTANPHLLEQLHKAKELLNTIEVALHEQARECEGRSSPDHRLSMSQIGLVRRHADLESAGASL